MNRKIPVKKIKIRTRVGKGYNIVTFEDTGNLILRRGEICYEANVWHSDVGLPGTKMKTIVIKPDSYGLGSSLGVYDKDIIRFTHNGNILIGLVAFDLEKVISGENPWTVTSSDGEIFTLSEAGSIRCLGTLLAGDSLSDFESIACEPVTRDPDENAAAPAEPEHACTIYTDGSSIGGYGGSSYVIISGGEKVLENAFPLGRATNNVAEIRAVMEGIKAALSRGFTSLTVFSDSEYVVKSVTIYSKVWRENGWKTSNGSDVKNLDLMKELITLVEENAVTLKHVKGHAGDKYNTLCDNLAKSAAQNQ